MRTFIAFIATIAFTYATTSNSTGCGVAPPMTPGETTKFIMNISDPTMNETVVRKYRVSLPYNYDNTKKYPVVMWFHWWGDDFTTLPYVDNQDVISVYPVGMSDYQRQHNVKGGWASWNNGDAGVETVCTSETTSYCYLSCDRIGKCGRCNSFTCYDDVYFVR
jgi:hypothetical protein